MERCTYCGSTMPDNALFCGHCGTRIKLLARVIDNTPDSSQEKSLMFDTISMTGDSSHPEVWHANEDSDSSNMERWSDDGLLSLEDTSTLEEIPTAPLVESVPGQVPAQIVTLSALPPHVLTNSEDRELNIAALSPKYTQFPQHAPGVFPLNGLSWIAKATQGQTPHLSRARVLVIVLVAIVVLVTSGIAVNFAIYQPALFFSGRNTDVKNSASLVVEPTQLKEFQLEQGTKAYLSVFVENIGKQKLTWSADTEGTPWLAVQPISGVLLPGSLQQTVYVAADTRHLAVGNYKGTLHFSSSVGEQRIGVNLKVVPPGSINKAIVDANPSSLDFGTLASGKQGIQALSIGNVGTQTLHWNINTTNTNWLKLSSNAGEILGGGPPSTVYVTADATHLAAGNYSATLMLTTNGGNAQIRVTLAVSDSSSPNLATQGSKLATSPPQLNISASNLSFETIIGGVGAIHSQLVQQIPFGNSGGQPLTWSANTAGTPWLKLDQYQGIIQPGDTKHIINVIADVTNLQPGGYSAPVNFISNGGSRTVSVSLIVSTPPSPCPACRGSDFQIQPSNLEFDGLEIGMASTMPVTLSNLSGQQMALSVDTGGTSWLSVNTNSLTLPGASQATISVTVNTTNLSPGIYSSAVYFNRSPILPVTVVVGTPPSCSRISLSINGLNFGSIQKGTTTPQILQEVISNGCTKTLTWNADMGATSWLTLSTGSGTLAPNAQQAVSVTASISNLGTGLYSAVVNFTSNGVHIAVPVFLLVVPPPQIAVNQASLSFGSIVTGSKSTLQEVVSNTGGGQLTWSVATGGAAWLSVDTSSGSVFSGNPETIHITVDATSLAAGSYTATLNFSSNGGSQPVTVTLVVTA